MKNSAKLAIVLIIFCLACFLAGCSFTQDGTQAEALVNHIKESFITESNPTHYGVGRTINVITDPYARFTAQSVGHEKVFDTAKLSSLNWFNSFVGDMQAETFTASSMHELYESANAEFKSSFNASATYENVFSAGLKSSFGFSAGASYEDTANEIYHTASQYFGANLVAIDGYYNIDKFKSLLSESFIADIIALENGTKTAQSIIDVYGTHAILAGYYGGKITYSSYIRNTSTKWTEDSALKYEAGIGVAIEGLMSVGTSTSTSLSTKLKIAQDTTEEKFTASSIGGTNTDASSLQAFLANYGTWVDSMNDMSIEKNVIVGLPDKSLVSIWDLLPNEYPVAKTKLEDCFNYLAESTNSAFLKEYERHYNEPTSDVDKFFDGGHGTIDSPYLISNAVQLKNIEKSMDSCFELTQDISLDKEWFGIGEDGSNYKAFTGILDGKGHKIIGLTRTTTPFYDNDKTARFGLFAKLSNATVKNIVFDKVAIEFPNNNNKSNHHLIVGTLCAQAENSDIKNIGVNGKITLGGTINNSYLYIGGIVGEMLGGVNIEYCYTIANITSTHEVIYQGGICGHSMGSDSKIRYSYYNGEMSCKAYNAIGGNDAYIAAGGIVGRIKKSYTTIVQFCYAKFNIRSYLSGNAVETTTTNRQGGIVGVAQTTDNTNTVKDNYAYYQYASSSNGDWKDGQHEIRVAEKKLGANNKVSESQLTSGNQIGGLFACNDDGYSITDPSYCWVYETGELPKLYWEIEEE